MSEYIWDPTTRQFRDKNGKVVAIAIIIALRNAIADATKDEARAITTAYLAGQETIGGWADGFAALIQDATIAGYILGRGGKNAVTAADDAKLAPILQTQLDAAKGFAPVLAATDKPMVDDNGDVIDPGSLSVDENGNVVDELGDPVMVDGEALTEANLSTVGDAWSGIDGLLSRAGSYEAAAVGGFSGGQSASWGDGSLPDMPPAHSGCRCYVTLDVGDGGQVIGSWLTEDDDRVCPECEGLASEYSDYPTGSYVTDGNAPSN